MKERERETEREREGGRQVKKEFDRKVEMQTLQTEI